MTIRRSLILIALCALLFCSAFTFIPHALQINENCETNNCSSKNLWGGYPQDPSLGAATVMLYGNCTPAGCFKDTSKGYFDQVMFDSVTTQYPTSGSVILGLEYRETNAVGYCGSGILAGVYLLEYIVGTNHNILYNHCISLAGNASVNDIVSMQFNRCVTCNDGHGHSGGLELWYYDLTTGKHILCNPCAFIDYDYGDNLPTTFYYTANSDTYYDNGNQAQTAVGTLYWRYNQFQSTNGTWNYQSNTGTISNYYNPPAQMWWYIQPAGSSNYGGVEDMCIADVSCPNA